MIVYEKGPEEDGKHTPAKEDAQPEQGPKTEARRRPLGILPVQAAIGAAVLVALLFLRALAPGPFAEFRDVFEREMARSVLITEDDV